VTASGIGDAITMRTCAANPETQLQGVTYEATVGVLADNLINIGLALAASAKASAKE
jgi:hypothetical protein